MAARQFPCKPSDLNQHLGATFHLYATVFVGHDFRHRLAGSSVQSLTGYNPGVAGAEVSTRVLPGMFLEHFISVGKLKRTDLVPGELGLKT